MKKLARSERAIDCPWCYAKKRYACRGERGITGQPHRQRDVAYLAAIEAGTIVVCGPGPCRALNARGWACQTPVEYGSTWCGRHQPGDDPARIKGDLLTR